MIKKVKYQKRCQIQITVLIHSTYGLDKRTNRTEAVFRDKRK